MKRRLIISFVLVASLIAGFGTEIAYASEVVKHELSTTGEPMVTTRKGVIEIACPADGKNYTFQIFSITGQLLKKVQLCDSVLAIEMPKGCYIIRCEAWVKKAIVN
ncbi:MAG: hypothetical protein NC230_04525 [Bacteroides sp.]|nr:hypothetical protein [Bacteroides sp.]